MSEPTTEPVAVDPRVTARDIVSRHFGIPNGNAAAEIADFNDAEIAAIVAAGNDRDAIKAVFSGVYDRKREAHQAEVQAAHVRLTRTAAPPVQAVRETHADPSAEE